MGRTPDYRDDHLPVESRDAAEPVHVLVQPVDDLGLRRNVEPAVLAVALGILGEELTADRLGGDHVVVAVVTDPLGQVVGNVKGRRGGHGILVINEVDGSNAILSLHAGVIRQDDHIGAQKIAVSENKLPKDKQVSDVVQPGKTQA